MLKPRGAARQALGMRQLHVGRVVAQPGEIAPPAQRSPVQRVVARAEQRVPLAAVQVHGFAKQRVVAQRGRRAVFGNHAHGKAAVHHPALDLRDAAHVQVQPHVRRGLRKLRNGAVQARLRVAGGLVEHRHRQLAAHALVQLVHAGAKAFHGGQQAQGFVVHALAFGRQRKARAPAAAQRQAQARFQVFQVAADGAGADVQLQLGRSQAAAFHHRLEHLQQAQIHVAHLPDQGARAPWGAGSGRGGVFYLHRSATELGYLRI